MKACRLALTLFIAIPLLAEDAKEASLPPLPENITLKTGTVIRKITVFRWEKSAVVVRHVGGIDPIRYDAMSPECRAAFEAHRHEGLVAEGVKKKAAAERNEQEQNEYLSKVAWEQRVREAIDRHSLIIGMTEEQAIKAWGRPDKINASSSATLDQWIYNRDSKSPTYVYFTGGILKSWQSER